ncbi:hypothetical protein Clacol_009435 [Clathrus columnatus]|uniref:Uncharacterized protein n=1 Tax=Clathrus columnatus TaxID=1419009 RepID=A0AAV5ATD0_9AGAM|nr:hypothetical protein Clacol_009435 [Clathrus columnatus]
MAHRSQALIRPENPAVYSKFRIEAIDYNPETDFKELTILNVNSDVAVIKFSSIDAEKSPPEYNLIEIWEKPSDRTGLARISGHIGEGKIYLLTDKGVIIKGDIVGGPVESQSITGTGTWTKG